MNDKKKQLLGDVLIIDDEPAICEILKAYCANMGCFRNIIFAHDGSLASNKLRNQKFALVLVDLKMPKKNGLDLIRELDDKTMNSRASVIVVSGNLDKTMFDKILALGVRGFLPKPFDEAGFQDKVLKVLGPKATI